MCIVMLNSMLTLFDPIEHCYLCGLGQICYCAMFNELRAQMPQPHLLRDSKAPIDTATEKASFLTLIYMTAKLNASADLGPRLGGNGASTRGYTH